MRFFSLLIILLPFSLMAQSRLLIGTYTKSMHVYSFNAETGALTAQDSTQELNNPSFLTVAPGGQAVYAVGEAGGGKVYALGLNGNQLLLKNTQSSGGNGPCHITIDKAGRNVIVANYGSGSVSVLPVLADGSLGAPLQTIQHTGSSVVESRQKGPHAHSANFSPDEKQVFVADLGIDKIMVYDYHPDNKQTPLTPAAIPFVATKPGMGPRHFTFHPNGKYAYVVGELNGDVTAYHYKGGTLIPFQSLSSAPGASVKFGLADVHISPDGKFLYLSDRDKQNYLAIFTINKNTGKLSFSGHQSTLGENPRNFLIDPSGKFVLAANQSTNNVVVFKRDLVSGKLTPTGYEISVQKPVCLQLVK
ncbi:lactonase family protein [Chitinophaga niabensis]|uniref:6-phosphogluconolactonase n=1 Tax=Chitinophaga niabensis TaxID=536979 RepID=A0A1N6GS58_9BACT|nr:lactonase family protein [Chitinophaga niabensis]SIO10343.1 6-phosphogluconolactonase [Chitinophaga niabensis]